MKDQQVKNLKRVEILERCIKDRFNEEDKYKVLSAFKSAARFFSSDSKSLEHLLGGSFSFVTHVERSPYLMITFLETFQHKYACVNEDGFKDVVEMLASSHYSYGDDFVLMKKLSDFAIYHKDFEDLHYLAPSYLYLLNSSATRDDRVRYKNRDQIISSLECSKTKKLSDVVTSFRQKKKRSVVENIFYASLNDEKSLDNMLSLLSKYNGDESVNEILRDIRRKIIHTTQDVYYLIDQYDTLSKKTNNLESFIELGELIKILSDFNDDEYSSLILPYLNKQDHLNNLDNTSIQDYFFEIHPGIKDNELANSFTIKEVNNITNLFHITANYCKIDNHYLGGSPREKVKTILIKCIQDVESIDGTIDQKRKNIMEWSNESIKRIKQDYANGLLYKNKLIVNG